MEKVLLFVFCFVTVCVTNSVAQVTIGTLDTPNATLDVRSKSADIAIPDGIIAPKLTGAQLSAKDGAYGNPQDGALVYVTAATGSPSGKTINVNAPGYYYYNAAAGLWIGFVKTKSEWFYMPKTLLPSTPGAHSVNLFNAYSASVTGAVGSNSSVSFSTVNPVGAASDYDYYVVGYDETAFSITSLTTAGILDYTVIGDVTNESYINIVLVRKSS